MAMTLPTSAQPTRKARLEQQRDLLIKRNTLRLDQLSRDGRDMSAEEAQAHQKELDEIGALTARIDKEDQEADQIRQFGGDGRDSYSGRGRDIGQRFIESAAGRWLSENKVRGAVWRTPSGDLQAATLTEDPASGGSLVMPTSVPGIVGPGIPPLSVRQLFAAGQTSSNAVVFMAETSFTPGAAPVLEAGLKPEQTAVFASTTTPVRKIAAWLPVTDEILDDQPLLRAYLNSRLGLAVRVAEDNQLINGDGIAPNLLGLLAQPGLAPAITQAATETSADAILRQRAAIMTLTGLVPDGVIMHPNDWTALQLLKDTTDRPLYSGLPFASPPTPQLWGMSVAITTAIAAQTSIVGCFASGGAMVASHGGLRVEASNSHADYFIRDLTAIRAEERIALVVFRQNAFGKVTLLAPVVAA